MLPTPAIRLPVTLSAPTGFGMFLAKLGGPETDRYRDAAEILDNLVLADDFAPFLTIPAYAYLD